MASDGSIEQSQISPHVTIALQGVGDKGEWHCQHGCPTRTNHQEWDKLQVLVVQEWDKSEAHATNQQAHAISHLGVLELRKHHSPEHTAHSLYGKEDAHPVARATDLGSVVFQTVSAMAPVE